MGSPPEHYFASSPSSASRPRQVVVAARGVELSLTTDRGTFSPTRVDPGTAFLVDRAPEPPARGRFLDLGCGYGPMTCMLAMVSPDAEVIGVDVNQRSRELCRLNAEANALSNVAVIAPDDYDGTRSIQLIWSNPPIRVGKDALHELLLGWLPMLAADGEAILVVNRHLGADSLQRWLDDAGFPTERLASKKGYRLLRSVPA